MSRTNKHELVRQHLKRYGSITSWEAIDKYGATRLASIICNLRKKGYEIETRDIVFQDRYGSTSTYAKYILIGE